MKKTLITIIIIMFARSMLYSQKCVQFFDQGKEIVLANQYLELKLDKRKGLISSINYKNQELVGFPPHTNWNIVGDEENDNSIRKFPELSGYDLIIDPSSNNGERAEVAFKYQYKGDTVTTPLDIEIRFALGCEDKGVYMSAIMCHKPHYPAFKVGQGRMIVTLNPKVFDFYTVDKNRRKVMSTADDVKNGLRRNVKEANLLTTGVNKGKVEHKYDYAAILAQTPTWGWTSTLKHVGVWMINPSTEYINGGPTQVGNTGHVETELLNHWQDGHYGGAALEFKSNEKWIKFIGPFYLYLNSGANNDEMWADALREAENQRKLWPFAWEKHDEYLHANQRGTLKGQIKVAEANYSNMWVGLAIQSDAIDNDFTNNWQYEGKNYQFWVKANNEGVFSIPNIRPGKYTLYAFADGVLGEFSKKEITVEANKIQNVGQLEWKPERFGKQLWEIGIPNRSAEEFRHGNDYWHWGLYMFYPKEFPNDVNFEIGRSDWSKDWNYCQPTVIGEDYKVLRGTTWSVKFENKKQYKGNATLRLAICGSRNGEQIKVNLNGNYIGTTGKLPKMGVMHRDGIRGKQFEVNIPFDASLIKPGTNTLQLSLNARNWTFGVLYDYLRLEVPE